LKPCAARRFALLGSACLLLLFALLPALPTWADPAAERAKLVEFFRRAFPQFAPDDYTYGALMFRPDARRQFDDIMEFPPFLSTIERGKQMWERPFGNGKRFADCFDSGGRNAAATFPRYDVVSAQVISFEMAINDCLRQNGQKPLALEDMNVIGVLVSYAKTLSDGARLDIRAQTPAAQAKLEAGRADYYRRRGQMNLACANCHINLAGRFMRDEIISPVLGQATHFPVFRRGGEQLLTVQAYFRRCFTQIRATPPALGSETMNNLEYYHAYLSNGLPMRASVYRK
jgi:sulfur-oxidizing protein SoxA